MLIDEFKRLRKDFEAHADRYPDLTLSVLIESAGTSVGLPTVKQQNHKVMLWQYCGNATAEDDFEFQQNRFGFANATSSAFAVIEGSETKLFCRMASRAGSIIPDEVRLSLVTNIISNVVPSSSPGKPIFAVNSDPISVWLNLVLVSLAVYQPERFTRAKLPVDPFAASLAVFDHILNRSQKPSHAAGGVVRSILEGEFDVSLSFPGEKRSFISQVAAGLRERSVNVFYDHYFEAELARPNLDILLQRVYRDQSKLVVVFTCRDYEQKEWCGLEWRAIRDLIKTNQSQKVMLFRFDDAELDGLFSIDGYIDLRRRTPEEAVEAIVRRMTPQVTEAQP
jgi:hypothetical protein